MKEEKESNPKKVTTKRNKEPKIKTSKSILEAFEQIVFHAKNSNFDSKFQKKVSPQTSYASEKLGLTHQQIILLSIFVDKSGSDGILLSEIAEFLGCVRLEFYVSLTM